MMPIIKNGIFILFFVIPVFSYSMTLETVLQKNDTIVFTLLLDKTVTIEERQTIVNLCNDINRLFSDYLHTNPIFDTTMYLNEGLKITVFDLKFLEDSLNFLDINKSKSFFNEKYYIKLVLNKDILQSTFFQRLKKNSVVMPELVKLLDSESQINVMVKCPGKCVETSLKKTTNAYSQHFDKADFNNGDVYFIYESIRFIPHIYFTVFTILVTIVIVFIKMNKKNF